MDTGVSACIHSHSIPVTVLLPSLLSLSSGFLRPRIFALQGGHSSSHSFSLFLSAESRRNILDIARTSAPGWRHNFRVEGPSTLLGERVISVRTSSPCYKRRRIFTDVKCVFTRHFYSVRVHEIARKRFFKQFLK